MQISLYVEEKEHFKMLNVPHFVVKDLVRDRLSESEISRIHRLASPTKRPSAFKSGSVIVNFSEKTAWCFNTKLNLPSDEPTWTLISEKLTLANY